MLGPTPIDQALWFHGPNSLVWMSMEPGRHQQDLIDRLRCGQKCSSFFRVKFLFNDIGRGSYGFQVPRRGQHRGYPALKDEIPKVSAALSMYGINERKTLLSQAHAFQMLLQPG